MQNTRTVSLFWCFVISIRRTSNKYKCARMFSNQKTSTIVWSTHLVYLEGGEQIMHNEKKASYVYGSATICVLSQYGEESFDRLVEEVIIQKVLEKLEKSNS